MFPQFSWLNIPQPGLPSIDGVTSQACRKAVHCPSGAPAQRGARKPRGTIFWGEGAEQWKVIVEN